MSRDDSTLAPGDDPVAPPALGNPAARPGPAAHERCPHCGTTAVLERSSSLRFVCGVCGKARVPIDDPKLERSFDERDALARATTARNAARVWMAISATSGAFSIVSLMFLALAVAFASPPLLASLLALLAAVTPLAFALWGRGRARAHEAAVGPALEEGWAAAAREIVEERGDVSADELARLLRVDGAWAERVHASLGAQHGVRARVREEDAALSFEADAKKLRVKSAVGDAEAAADEASAAPEEERERA
ncbi:MAG: hypothetical protein IT374_26790 [Polyangiaceae bacterium]|nr:hypothetical protein [Polyangiaceae bacterium]